ncbi:MAG: TonB-dependent receptor domain-containing protein [Acidobacteriota bacterium]
MLAASASLYGQAAAINGQIEGTVTDGTGAAVSGAKVTAENTAAGFQRTVTTRAEGLYRLPVLPLGSYRVRIEAPGFRTAIREGIVLNAGTTAVVNQVMEPGTVESTITVSEAAGFTEPARTDFGSTLNQNFVANLPLVSRNPYNFILVQPNVTGRPNTEFGVPRKVMANGFNNRINYQIDGNNNVQSDRAGIRLILISSTFVQEVQQVSNGYAAEFGNSVGTVFNTITKSGTNEYHGEAGYLFRRTNFSAAPALLGPGRRRPETNVDSLLGGGGGPLKKARAFFHAAWERVVRDLPQPVTATPAVIASVGLPAEFANPIPFAQNVQFFFIRGDVQLTRNHRLALRTNGHRNDSPFNSNAFGLGVQSRTFEFVDRSYVYAAQFISTFGPAVVNEFRMQSPLRNQRNNGFSGTGSGPAIVIPNQILFGGPTNVGFVYRELAPEFSENLSWNRGTHAFKFGFNYRAIRDEQIQATFAQYTFPTVQAFLDAQAGRSPRGYTNFTQTVGEPNLPYNHNFWNFYAQDSWKPRPNLTLSYGLRYDLYLLPAGNSQSPLAVSRSFRVDRNNFAPRLALAWSLSQDQKAVVRASYGMFYDAPQTDIYRRAILNNGSPIFFNISAGPAASFAPNYPNVFSGIPTGFTPGTQDVTAVSPEYRTLYSHNANLSISRQLPWDLTLTATYLYTKGTGLPIYSNRNLIPSGQTLADGRPIFGAGRLDPRFNGIVLAESVGNSVYSGGTFTLSKRMAKGFEGFASYTWAQAIDDAPEQNNIDAGAFWLSDISNRGRDRGNSLSDRRHSFNASFVYESKLERGNAILRTLLSDNRVAIFFLAMHGDLFNIGSNRVLNGDATSTTAFQRPLFIGRNTFRGPRTEQLDLRYSRKISIRERYRA